VGINLVTRTTTKTTHCSTPALHKGDVYITVVVQLADDS